MDEDLIAVGVVLVLFLTFPALIGISITGCIAFSRTRAWARAQHKAVTVHEESQNLVASQDELDFLDTDDENDYNARKADEESDKRLTFSQKFHKEFRNIWSGKGGVDIAKKRECEERRKLVKAVAREMDRRERRRERAGKDAADTVELGDLPPYMKS